MLGILGGVKLFAVLGIVIAAAGTLAWVTHTLTSGAAARAEIHHVAAAANDTAKTAEALRQNAKVQAAAVARGQRKIRALEAQAIELRSTIPTDSEICPDYCVVPGP